MTDFDFTSEGIPRGTNSVKWDSCEEGVIPMWVAEMDFPTAPCIVRALHERIDKAFFGYTLIPDSYYRSVCSWFSRRHGWDMERDWIMPVQGIVPATSIAIKSLTEAGDKVILCTPAYNCFFHNITNQGCAIAESPLLWDAEKRLYRMNFDEIERLCADPSAKSFLLCNPHNPSGRCWTREELIRLGEICLTHGVTVISDEIHCEICAPGRSYTPFASISPEFAQHSISFVSPTKGFTIPGLQIANIVCANGGFRERMDRVINIWEHCDVNQLGIVALEAAYTDEGAAWLDRMNEVVHNNFLMLRGLFEERFPLVRVPELEATYLLWVDFADAFAASGTLRSLAGQEGRTVAGHLLEKQGVRINDGAIYGGPSGCRINLACPETTMKEGLRRIAEGLGEIFGQTA